MSTADSLTIVRLEGVMGEKFGREWRLSVDSVPAALRLIDANKPGFLNWIRQNAEIYSRYHVVCEYASGAKEEVDEESLDMRRKPKVMTFEPLIAGESAGVRVVVGVVMMVVGAMTSWAGGTALFAMGFSLAVGGIIEMLSPRPKQDQQSGGTNSYYFNGAVNTTGQGVPVQLIYGRCKVGSHAISASISIDQLAAGTAPDQLQAIQSLTGA